MVQGNHEERFIYQESHSNHAVEFGHQQSTKEQITSAIDH